MDGALRIGIIGGGGWLGGAIAGALLDTGVVGPEHLALSYRRERPARLGASFWTANNQALVDRSDVIVLSVRPSDWPSIAVNAHDKLIISVMAGIRLEQLAARHKTKRVVRALPNAAAEVAKSYTPWIASGQAGEDDRKIVRAIFDACGTQDEVTSESDIDYLTGLTGSGPAFPALLASAMMRDAVAYGLQKEVALRAVSTVFIGAGRLLERRDDSPDAIVEALVNYRGTTAAGIESMRATGFEAAVAEGLSAAFQKSVSMGKAF
ncbi:pyrroline-5-carboxylate reductase dimerization domain-containing protein [Rhizobium calliandrae]|uniref:Pyrroline-5-carboxylate reductase n=1 Tax=Rhizobium calliandrae TaxID=1312182 RepID=A0ABT7KCQ4_9HYPH|nr:pyrroline-5-carboxylate reductase dimerization domain-containing protein [Rhizobium calliandrae]MDL2405768.1 pyrroline-5-carboxylate reductase dimerization domain-containing protein [Rhizobium calliandrae]